MNFTPNIRNFEEKRPVIHQTAFIDPTAIIIGDVVLGEESSVWPCCVLRGDIHSIKIGKRTNIQDGTIIHVTHASEFSQEGHPVLIGDEVIIGHQVVLHGCTVLGQSLIGIGVKIMDGAIIEPEVVVGAGSLVPPGKTLESGYLWLGTPVEKVRPLKQTERQFLPYSAHYYVNLAKKHKASLGN